MSDVLALLNPGMNLCVAAPPPRTNSYRQSATPICLTNVNSSIELTLTLFLKNSDLAPFSISEFQRRSATLKLA
jgi:hypothetical protein